MDKKIDTDFKSFSIERSSIKLILSMIVKDKDNIDFILSYLILLKHG